MTELEKAIQLIEEAGGIVMMADGELEDESRDEYLARLEIEEEREKAELEEFQKMRKQSLKEAKKEFDQMLGDVEFSYDKVADMAHGQGLDMDDIENMIHNFY